MLTSNCYAELQLASPDEACADYVVGDLISNSDIDYSYVATVDGALAEIKRKQFKIEIL